MQANMGRKQQCVDHDVAIANGHIGSSERRGGVCWGQSAEMLQARCLIPVTCKRIFVIFFTLALPSMIYFLFSGGKENLQVEVIRHGVVQW